MSRFCLFALTLCVMSVFASCNSAGNYNPDKKLSVPEQDSFKYSLIRYIGHLPKRATDSTKWDASFDQVYLQQAASFRLDKYYPNPKDGYVYFEISRIAPSFRKEYVATGGRLKYGSDSDILEYEEIYRTWKMDEERLSEKTMIFFKDMVAGADLSQYYTVNTGDTEHIEFPDEHTFFDKDIRKWVN